jgi:chorismate synthase
MNTIGQMFRVTSFGESHGSHVGCVIDGCPAGLLLDLDQMQTQVNRRKSNQSAFATTRHEEDQLEMMSGLFESTTTGAPICILIKNKDVKSADYDLLKDVYRPNHADYTYAAKYGIRDHRGGGRSSVRVTAPLVAAGDIAYQLLRHQTAIQTTAYVSQIGTVAIPNRNAYTHLDLLDIDANELRCPDEQVARQMKAHIDAVGGEGEGPVIGNRHHMHEEGFVGAMIGIGLPGGPGEEILIRHSPGILEGDVLLGLRTAINHAVLVA